MDGNLSWDARIAWHYGMLERWMQGRVPASARGLVDTADIVQETFLSALRYEEALRHMDTGAFQAFLRRTAMNRIHDEIRHLRH